MHLKVYVLKIEYMKMIKYKYSERRAQKAHFRVRSGQMVTCLNIVRLSLVRVPAWDRQKEGPCGYT
jgi:hypothetical protein